VIRSDKALVLYSYMLRWILGEVEMELGDWKKWMIRLSIRAAQERFVDRLK